MDITTVIKRHSISIIFTIQFMLGFIRDLIGNNAEKYTAPFFIIFAALIPILNKKWKNYLYVIPIIVSVLVYMTGAISFDVINSIIIGKMSHIFTKIITGVLLISLAYFLHKSKYWSYWIILIGILAATFVVYQQLDRIVSSFPLADIISYYLGIAFMDFLTLNLIFILYRTTISKLKSNF